tara:strand:+ start:285 stop:788 length:504 start_codon:yes stop_codon:yes gene_type:complete
MNLIKAFNNKKFLIFSKENFYSTLLILLLFLADRISKNIIIKNFSENVYYINEFINFHLIWNTGIGFGFFSSLTSLLYNVLTLVIGVIIILLLYLTLMSGKNKDKIIYSMITGGALGNFYDRFVFTAVPDFIDIHYNNFHWFTFNIADIFISLGVILFIITELKIKN